MFVFEYIEPKPQTLADMSREDREACRFMMADVEGDDSRVVILDPHWEDGSARLMWPDGFIKPIPTEWGLITPLSTSPRMTWPGDGQVT